jgi:putative tryptophan/tyrosine transport system substrate-binding protein
MRRRDFTWGLGAAVLVSPSAVRAQQNAKPFRIGYFPLGSPTNQYDQSLVDAFQLGLRQTGLVEKRDIALEITWIGGDNPEKLIAKAIQDGIDLLVPCGSSASAAAKHLTASIPIVFISVGNPVGLGLVRNLPNPGFNVTGFGDGLGEISGKLIEVSAELLRPGFRSTDSIDYLWHSNWPDGPQRFADTEQAARSAGIRLRSHDISETKELSEVLATIKSMGGSTMIVQPSPLTYRLRGQIISLANKLDIATVFAFPIAARDGALMSYGPDYVALYQKAPLYVERIIRGTNAGDLPVQLPTKIVLLVNLATAKALKREVPLPVLVRADELIE